MPSHVQDLVLRVVIRLVVQSANHILKPFPLRFAALRVKVRIGVVRAIDKAEVARDL